MFLLLPCVIEISFISTNSVDPDQMPRSMASDLGLYCFPVTLFWSPD